MDIIHAIVEFKHIMRLADVRLQGFGLSKLGSIVDTFWAEIANEITTLYVIARHSV